MTNSYEVVGKNDQYYWNRHWTRNFGIGFQLNPDVIFGMKKIINLKLGVGPVEVG